MPKTQDSISKNRDGPISIEERINNNKAGIATNNLVWGKSFFESAHYFPKNPPIYLTDYQKAVLDLAKFIEGLGPIMIKGKDEMIRSANDMIEAYKKSKEGAKKSAHGLVISDLLMDHKKSSVPHDKPPDYIVDLILINRYLLLLSMVMESAINDHRNNKTPSTLAPYFTEAYDKIMKPHSNIFTNVTFNLLVNCAPSCKLFVQKLQNGSHATEVEVYQKLEVYSQQLIATNRHVSDLLTKAGYTI